MTKVLLTTILSGMLLIAFLASAAAVEMPAGQSFQTRVAGSAEPEVAGCDFDLWVPENLSVVRCIFVINMRAAGKHLYYKDPQWRALAVRNGAAIMYCRFEAYGVRDNGYGLSMLTACNQFAVQLNRPELKHAPFVLWGHSMGGRVVQDFVRFKPSRVLAFHIALRGNPSPAEFMQEEASATKVPGLYLMGENDTTPADIRRHFLRARKQGAPRAWVRLPGQGHWPRGMSFREDKTTSGDWKAWAAHDVVLPWTSAIIAQRLPERADPRHGPMQLREIKISDGWLGDDGSGKVAPADEFQGSRAESSWLPDEESARAWADQTASRQPGNDGVERDKQVIKAPPEANVKRKPAKSKAAPGRGRLTAAPLFTDHMVLQQGIAVPVWGNARPGQKVTVRFAGQQHTAPTGKRGQWQVKLLPLKATAEGRTLTIESDGEVRNYKDVVVGEVWVCSGQSNMQYAMKQTNDGKAAIAAADHPLIRFFGRTPGVRAPDHWQACKPENVAHLSAVAYFFARRLHQDQKTPIGLIVRAVGGTTIQRWASPRHYRTNAIIQKLAEQAAERSDEFAQLEVEKKKYDKRNKPPAGKARWLAEMSNLAYYRNVGGLYERMIRPLQPFAIRGVIWYQGEFNNRNRQAFEYREWQENLVQGWRKEWAQGDFPFLFVQMQGLGNATTALLRESQATTLKRCNNTAMAVICDQSTGLHPLEKQVAGDRLAIAASSLVYGADHPAMGPSFKSLEIVDGKAVVTFDRADDGLVCKGEPLRGFFIAGADKKFHLAKAEITGKNQVTVRSEKVPQPVAVRYAWLNTPRGHMNLFNHAGLPAAPFRTDNWPDTQSLHDLLPAQTPRRKK